MTDRNRHVRPVAIIVLALASLAVTACGGDDTQIDVATFADCIEAQDTDFALSEEDVDLLAEGAGVGAIQLLSENNEIQVVGERTAGDAEDTASSYEGFEIGQIEQIGTVVVAANNTMTDEELDPIKSCLSEQSIE